MVYLTMLSTAQTLFFCQIEDDAVNNKLEKMWKEIFKAEFVALTVQLFT
jgi:hypothetical protein